MKSHPFAFSTAIICLLFVLGSCNTFVTPIEGSETAVKKTFDLKDFSCIQMNQSFEAEIVQSDGFGVSIEISDNLVKYLIVEVVGDTLCLGMSEKHTYLRPILNGKIQLPLLKKLIAKNESMVIIPNYKGKNMDMFLSGASELSGKINLSNNLNINASGESKLDLDGRAENSFMDFSGGSKIRGEEFTINNNFNVLGSGASEIELILNNQIRAELSGGSILDFSGNGTVSSEILSGDSEINKN